MLNKWRMANRGRCRVPSMAVFALLVGTALSGVAANMQIPAMTLGKPEGTVDIRVMLQNVTGLQGYFFTLSYNASLLELVAATPGTFVQSWGGFFSNVHTVNNTPVSVSVAASGSRTLGGSGEIAVLSFRVKGQDGQSCSLLFQAAELNDGAVSVSTTGGQFIVSGTAVEMALPPTLSLAPGDVFTVPVSIDETAAGILGYYFEVSWDPGYFVYSPPPLRGGLIGSWAEPVANVILPQNGQRGTARIASYGQDAVTGPGTIAHLRFAVRDDAPSGSSILCLEYGELNDGAVSVVLGNCIATVERESPLPVTAGFVPMLLAGVWCLRRRFTIHSHSRRF